MSTKVRIDKNIPIPRSRGKYPFREMEVGDSFLCPKGSEKTIYSAAGQATTRIKGRRFIVRKTEDGFRVWRVE